MKIDFNVEIMGLDGKEFPTETTVGPDGKKIPGKKIIAAEQLCALAMSDRGESVDGPREAFQLNALMGRIACAQEPAKYSKDEIELLETILDNALKANRVSTFLVGRLYGILEGQASSGKDTKKGKDTKAQG